MAGRQDQTVRRFENPYAGAPRSTDLLALTTSSVTILGPVPKGHVYIITNAIFANHDGVSRNVNWRTQQDNGSGHSFEFRIQVAPAFRSLRLPEQAVNFGLGTKDLFPQWDIYMEEDDILQVMVTVSPGVGVDALVQYWDTRQ